MKKEHNLEIRIHGVVAVDEHILYTMSREEALKLGWSPEEWVNIIQVYHYPEANTMQVLYHDDEGYVKDEEEENDAEVITHYLEEFEKFLSQAAEADSKKKRGKVKLTREIWVSNPRFKCYNTFREGQVVDVDWVNVVYFFDKNTGEYWDRIKEDSIKSIPKEYRLTENDFDIEIRREAFLDGLMLDPSQYIDSTKIT